VGCPDRCCGSCLGCCLDRSLGCLSLRWQPLGGWHPLPIYNPNPSPKIGDYCTPSQKDYCTPSNCLKIRLLSNCSGSSWRSGAQAPYRSRLGWSAGALRHVLSSHTGSFLLYLVWELRSHPFYLIKSLCNCTSAAPMSSVPSVKRSTVMLEIFYNGWSLSYLFLSVYYDLTNLLCLTYFLTAMYVTV